MNTIARLILVAVLAFGSGCAKPDWIQQTLVTVDVTGTWQSTEGGYFKLELEQNGSRVTGSITAPGFPGLRTLEGTVAGDVFQFEHKSGGGRIIGEMKVSEDEMKGNVSISGTAGVPWRREIILQRAGSSAPPRSQ